MNKTGIYNLSYTRCVIGHHLMFVYEMSALIELNLKQKNVIINFHYGITTYNLEQAC